MATPKKSGVLTQSNRKSGPENNDHKFPYMKAEFLVDAIKQAAFNALSVENAITLLKIENHHENQ